MFVGGILGYHGKNYKDKFLGVGILKTKVVSNSDSGYNLPGISSDGFLSSLEFSFPGNSAYFTELAIAYSGQTQGSTVVYVRGGAYGGTWSRIV